MSSGARCDLRRTVSLSKSNEVSTSLNTLITTNLINFLKFAVVSYNIWVLEEVEEDLK